MNWFSKIANTTTSGVRLWLDDVRDPADSHVQRDFGSVGDEIWVKTPSEAIDMLREGNVAHISLDHDLGDDEIIGTGYDLAKWIEEAAFNKKIQRIAWRVHSANPVGRTRMASAMQSADRFWDMLNDSST